MMKKFGVLTGVGLTGLMLTACGSNEVKSGNENEEPVATVNDSSMLEAAETFMEAAMNENVEQMESVIDLREDSRYKQPETTTPAETLLNWANNVNIVDFTEEDFTLEEVSENGVRVYVTKEEGYDHNNWGLNIDEEDGNYYVYELMEVYTEDDAQRVVDRIAEDR